MSQPKEFYARMHGDPVPAPPLRFVCGFLFSPGLDSVALIRKNRPQWMLGRLNGIGGKIEPGETPWQAMCREFEEEAGVAAVPWLLFHREYFPDTSSHVFFFCATHAALHKVRTVTDEKVYLCTPGGKYVDEYGLETLHYLLPMAQTYLSCRLVHRWQVEEGATV